MNNKSEGTKNFIVGFTDFFQSLIFIGSIANTIIAPIIKMFEKMSLPSWISKYSEIFDMKSIGYWINCVVMVFFIIKLVIVITHKNQDKNEELINIMDCLHTNYIHNMRDHIHELEETEDLLPRKKHKDIKNIEKNYNYEFKRLENITQECVNQVSDVINGFMGMPEEGKATW